MERYVVNEVRIRAKYILFLVKLRDHNYGCWTPGHWVWYDEETTIEMLNLLVEHKLAYKGDWWGSYLITDAGCAYLEELGV